MMHCCKSLYHNQCTINLSWEMWSPRHVSSQFCCSGLYLQGQCQFYIGVSHIWKGYVSSTPILSAIFAKASQSVLHLCQSVPVLYLCQIYLQKQCQFYIFVSYIAKAMSVLHCDIWFLTKAIFFLRWSIHFFGPVFESEMFFIMNHKSVPQLMKHKVFLDFHM